MGEIYLITGGAGFVGSTIAIGLKKAMEDATVIALDSLRRRGSELNLSRFKNHGIKFLHGDVRNNEDLESIGPIDCLIECSAEPSVQAGYGRDSKYTINTNLLGTIQCLELAKKYSADFIFLSTSRVYPIGLINSIKYSEDEIRYEINKEQDLPGISKEGISEIFPLQGTRSLYGASKLCSEFIIQEFIEMYGIRGIINRCGVLSGPWQMGKVDQGFVALWVARHLFRGTLRYIGYDGEGKQVRDILHVDDLFSLILNQLDNFDRINGQVFNVGGGKENSISLQELTALCKDITGNSIKIGREKETRKGDIRIYITDNSLVKRELGWEPTKNCEQIVEEVAGWLTDNRELLQPIFL